MSGCLRFYLGYTYKNTPVTDRNNKPFLPLLSTTLVLAALAFSSIFIFIIPVIPTEYRLLVFLVIGGMVSGATSTLAANLKLMATYITIMLAPMVLYYFSLGDKISLSMGILCLVYYISMLSAGRTSHYSLLNSLTLRHENIDLITYLSEQKTITAKLNEELEHLSLHDTLTGLHNRRYLFKKLDQELNNFAENYRQEQDNISESNNIYDLVYGFFILDIDYFKQVNDTYGHDAGDLVLQNFSQLLTQTLRKEDVIIRWGGEEFLVVLKNTNLKSLTHIAEKLRHQIEAFKFPITLDKTITKTCSIGFVSFPFCKKFPSVLSFEETISLADRALYHAKNTGRNKAVYLAAKEDALSSQDDLIETINSFDTALEKQFCTFIEN